MESLADDAGGGRRAAPPLQPDRLLFLSGAQSVPAQSEDRSERQIAYTKEAVGDHAFELDVGIGTKRHYWVTKGDLQHAREWYGAGFTNAMKSPDDTLIFVTPEEEKMIRADQAACMGCLSQCSFSSWADNEKNSTGRLADSRSFCIQKTLQDIAYGGPVEENLMFAGHAAFRFKSDPSIRTGLCRP